MGLFDDAFSGSVGAAIGAAGGLAGGFLGQEASAQSARDQMEFQERSYRNRYQWTMGDLRKAGLNPILAYQQGVGGGLGGARYEGKDIVSPAVASALAAKRQAAELKLMKEQTAKTAQETARAGFETMNADMTNWHLHELYKQLKLQTQTMKASAAAAKHDEAIFKTPYLGKFLRGLDLLGRSVNPFASSANELKRLQE